MEFPNSLRLCDADSTLKIFITAFLVVLTAGYMVGLLFIGHTTSGSAQGLTEEYRGSPEGREEIKYAKSPDEMYILLHNHILSLSLVFFVVGGIFSFSSIVPAGLKRFLIVEPIVAIATTFGGIWLTRYISEIFSWLVIFSGISMAACYGIMVTLTIVELWRPRRV